MKLHSWYEKVEKEKIEPFLVVAQSIKAYEDAILNYFKMITTNASTESKNTKIKSFRALVRRMRDTEFFQFCIAKLYGSTYIAYDKKTPLFTGVFPTYIKLILL